MKVNKGIKAILIGIFSVIILVGCSDDNKNDELAKINIIEKCQAEGDCEDVISSSLNAIDFKEKLDSGKYDLIDIRTHDEFIKERIADVLNIDIYEDDFDEKLDHLDKEKKYLIYCRTGHRSSMGLQRMRTLGFPEVYDLSGGIEEWKKAGFETIGTK